MAERGEARDGLRGRSSRPRALPEAGALQRDISSVQLLLTSTSRMPSASRHSEGARGVSVVDHHGVTVALDAARSLTLRSDGQIVPWLAAEGPLSYSPESPPEREYFFQYNRVLPGIFPEGANLRRQRYFGAQSKTDARHALRFWQLAREGAVQQITLVMGTVGTRSVTAPLAVYRMDAGPLSWRGSAHVYVLIQHGSLQFISTDDQPELDAGMLTLYRGVQDAETFSHLRISRTRKEQFATWQRYAALQAHVLADSVRSFNSIHDRTKRCETGHIRHQSWVTDDLARGRGLDIDGEGFEAALWSTTHQSFTLERWVAENKFGPHFVVGRTPLGNVRLTTFFAGEHEVRIIDPDQFEIVEAHGCKLELRDA